MLEYDAADIAIERRHGILPFAGVVIVLSTAALLWAFSLGEMEVFRVMALLAGATVAALIFAEPLVGLCLMVFLIPVETVYAFAGGMLTGTKAVGVVTFASFLVNTLFRQGVLRFDKQSRWMFAFVLWIALSFIWARGRGSVTFFLLTVAQIALFWVLIRTSVGTPHEVCAVSTCFIGGTLAAVLVSAILPRWGTAPRLIFTTGNPNHLGRDIVVSLILVLYYAPRVRSWTKLTCVAAGGVLLLALVLTQSRASWLGALVCIPLVLLGHKKVMPLAAVAVMAFLAVVLFALQVLSAHLGVTAADLEHRWDSMFHTRVIRASRLDVWRAGIVLGCQNPILGVGAGGFLHSVVPVIEQRPHLFIRTPEITAHNSLISVFAELGLVGLVLFTGVLWHCGRAIARQPRSLEKMLAWALFASALVQMTFMNAHVQKTTWFALALALSAFRMRPQAERQPSGLFPDGMGGQYHHGEP